MRSISHQPRRIDRLGRTALAILVLGLVWQISAALRPARWVMLWCTVDDTYLALEAALAFSSLASIPAGEIIAKNRCDAALWMRANIPPDERVASWNAGELAYFSERTVINLDGSVNSREYYDRIRAGTTGPGYWREFDVRWIIDYAENVEQLLGDEWQLAALFGEHPERQQIIAQRARPRAAEHE